MKKENSRQGKEKIEENGGKAGKEENIAYREIHPCRTMEKVI